MDRVQHLRIVVNTEGSNHLSLVLLILLFIFNLVMNRIYHGLEYITGTAGNLSVEAVVEVGYLHHWWRLCEHGQQGLRWYPLWSQTFSLWFSPNHTYSSSARRKCAIQEIEIDSMRNQSWYELNFRDMQISQLLTSLRLKALTLDWMKKG